jgi:hypothetical protein
MLHGLPNIAVAAARRGPPACPASSRRPLRDRLRRVVPGGGERAHRQGQHELRDRRLPPAIPDREVVPHVHGVQRCDRQTVEPPDGERGRAWLLAGCPKVLLIIGAVDGHGLCDGRRCLVRCSMIQSTPAVRLRQAGRGGRAGRAAQASGDRRHALAFVRIGTLLGAKVARWEPGLSAEGSIAGAGTSATRGTGTGPRARLTYYRQQELVQAK